VDGSKLISGAMDGTIRVHDIGKFGRATQDGNNKEAILSMGSCSKYFATAGENGSVKIWKRGITGIEVVSSINYQTSLIAFDQ